MPGGSIHLFPGSSLLYCPGALVEGNAPWDQESVVSLGQAQRERENSCSLSNYRHWFQQLHGWSMYLT